MAVQNDTLELIGMIVYGDESNEQKLERLKRVVDNNSAYQNLWCRASNCTHTATYDAGGAPRIG